MIAVNYLNLKDNLGSYCDKVIDDSEALIVTRKDNKNLVILSLEEYNNILENLYIMSNKKYYDELIQSKQRIEKQQIKKSLEELRALEDE